jgi:uncharacterized protein YacL
MPDYAPASTRLREAVMPEPSYRITIVDFDIPFGRLVAFFVKASLAAIPAAIIATFILSLIWIVIAAIFGLAVRQPY